MKGKGEGKGEGGDEGAREGEIDRMSPQGRQAGMQGTGRGRERGMLVGREGTTERTSTRTRKGGGERVERKRGSERARGGAHLGAAQGQRLSRGEGGGGGGSSGGLCLYLLTSRCISLTFKWDLFEVRYYLTYFFPMNQSKECLRNIFDVTSNSSDSVNQGEAHESIA